jgi:hypothetical protein
VLVVAGPAAAVVVVVVQTVYSVFKTLIFESWGRQVSASCSARPIVFQRYDRHFTFMVLTQTTTIRISLLKTWTRITTVTWEEMVAVGVVVVVAVAYPLAPRGCLGHHAVISINNPRCPPKATTILGLIHPRQVVGPAAPKHLRLRRPLYLGRREMTLYCNILRPLHRSSEHPCILNASMNDALR